MKFNYNQEKNAKLKAERGISFDEIIALIAAGKLIDVLNHPKQQNYPNQKIYVIDVDDYVWLVPFIEHDAEVFLKTAFPSRKHTKQYMEDKND